MSEGLLCTIENGVVTFQRDASYAEKAECIAIMKANPVSVKSTRKVDWLKFKQHFVTLCQSNFLNADLDEIMNAKSVSSGFSPVIFGNIVATFIRQYFDNSIIWSVSTSLKGYDLYIALEEEFSKMDILEQVQLLIKAGKVINSFKPSIEKIEENTNLVKLIDYYIPPSHYQLVWFLSLLPKVDVIDFLKEIGLWNSKDPKDTGNFDADILLQMYKKFKLKNAENEKIELVQDSLDELTIFENPGKDVELNDNLSTDFTQDTKVKIFANQTNTYNVSQKTSSNNEIILSLLETQNKNHEESLIHMMDTTEQLVSLQYNQNIQVLDAINNRMFDELAKIRQELVNSLRLPSAPSEIPAKNVSMDPLEHTHNITTTLLSHEHQQEQENIQRLVENTETQTLEFDIFSESDEEENDETTPQTRLFDTTNSSSSTAMEDHQRMIEMASKNVPTSFSKLLTHPNDDEYITLVKKQKKVLRKGRSLHAESTNLDGDSHEIKNASSEVLKDHTLMVDSTSMNSQVPITSKVLAKTFELNGTTQDAAFEVEKYDVDNKAKYPIPENMIEAMKTPQAEEWSNALNDEIKSIRVNKVCREIKKSKVPPEALIVKSRLELSVEQQKDSQMKGYDRFKVKLVAKGFSQEVRKKYLDIYSPVMKYDALRLILSIAGMFKWNIKQLDAKDAFLNGNLNVPVYLEIPPGVTGSKNNFWELNKSLYSLKQSPRVWSKK
ncbi:hypothetical protein CANINC_001369 [Pichia inconspicua]|uniref:Reverse transcriptase Ty1/copia-type domain-containing protein n=1 Tax=Pichia inconspicua TaxID=52247 RepID=A0A4T0X501_9ASCO|nr:hypothetical protein CANINC_001369 [[Candida] inconspicua]